MAISYTEPRISKLDYEGVRVLVLHEYENHPMVSGNKWWKLKYNLEAAKNQGYDTVLTFGGAYSNHIYASAAAAKLEGFKSIGVIRGEEVENPVLRFARSQGMELRFISREEYRHKEDRDYGNAFVIPEGGTNEYAIEGCAEWGRKLSSLKFDVAYVAVGTGGTLKGLTKEINVVGVPVLKGFMGENLLNGYDFGGYAKMPAELMTFCREVREKFGLIVEPVYTGKLFYAVFDQIKKKEIPPRTTILVIHSGGMNSISDNPS